MMGRFVEGRGCKRGWERGGGDGSVVWKEVPLLDWKYIESCGGRK